jgi:peroxiredoxin family protein
MAENGAGEVTGKRMSIICWSGDLDRVWPTLILSTTAAASGLEVDVFFTFWGLRVLQRNDKRVTGKNWMQKGESLVDRGGTDHLSLGKIHFGGAGTRMIKKLADSHQVASPTELLQMAVDLGVRLHPCQMTMDLYGFTKDDFIDGIQPPLGAASYIEMAAEAAINLFI